MYEKLPEVLEDKFWDTIDVVIPYTKEAEQFHKKPFHGSAANIEYASIRRFFVFSLSDVLLILCLFIEFAKPLGHI